MDKIDDMLDFEDDDMIIIITDENGNEYEYIVIDTLSHKGSNYMLVTPALDDEDSDAFEASIIKETGDEGDEVIYSLVDDDNEFNEVAALFMENDGDYGIEV